MNMDEYMEIRRAVIQESARRLSVPLVLPGEYHNPFDFIDEFDNWFEFERRRHFGKESTHSIIASMLAHDQIRAIRSMDTNYSQIKQMARQYAGRAIIDNRSVSTTITP